MALCLGHQSPPRAGLRAHTQPPAGGGWVFSTSTTGPCLPPISFHLLNFTLKRRCRRANSIPDFFFFFFNKKTSLFPMKFSKYACLRIEAPLPASSSRDAGFSPLQQEQAGSHFLGDCSTRFRRTEQPLCQDPWQMLARRQGSSWSSEHSVTAHCQALQQGALTQT